MGAFFVYVAGRARHEWRFVFLAKSAVDGDDAIDQAQAEATLLGNELDGVGYMAVAADAITTRTGARSRL